QLRVREPEAQHVRTFPSNIDGSVQYYAVTPPPVPVSGGETPAMILSLHGASVEGRRQAEVYGAKDWAFVVAPTNRRPFGFDWEDWGRKDAVEVLALAEQRFGTDPMRTYLTGHSMGGHGTWQIGAHLSNRFAAIAPSAGWKDFWSYAGGAQFDPQDAIAQLLSRSVNPSRTGLLAKNYLHSGVYILHGDADETVDVSEARAMRELLGTFHPNFAYYERPGAGHWWGDECVDWPPLIEFLQQNKRPDWDHALQLEFTTVSPAIRSQHGWLRIDRAVRILEPSRLQARLDPAERTLELEGDNLGRFQVDLRGFLEPEAGKTQAVLPPGKDLVLRWGRTELAVPYDRLQSPLPLEPEGASGLGLRTEPVAPWYKGPHRMGPFKEGFDHRMIFVYGTVGSPEENAWSLAKARYDQETWRYRGNGSVPMVRDVDFVPASYADRSVVLYGNQQTNSAWGSLLGEGAFQLTREAVSIGDHRVEGPGLGLLLAYPRKDSDTAMVVVIGGTGLPGCRLLEQMPYFVSGVGYPDWTVFDTSFLEQ
ncbi:MAG TPA: prolyl oligopeptidase family serine peptidase, partial [Planctomycetota bacterium]|nr:prolyl oligopeptidase family serine peptidase [Planctomycetota bacterium]